MSNEQEIKTQKHVASVHLGDVESANALAKEIVRRFNEFPENLKQ